MLKWWNHSTTTRNYAVTYYKTLEGVPWHQALKELKNDKYFQKTVGVSSTSKNCLQTISKSPKKFELKKSWKALGALDARLALPVHPVFEEEKSKA